MHSMRRRDLFAFVAVAGAGASALTLVPPTVSALPAVTPPAPTRPRLPSHLRQVDVRCEVCGRTIGTMTIDDMDQIPEAVCTRCHERQVESARDEAVDDMRAEQHDLEDEVKQKRRRVAELVQAVDENVVALNDLHMDVVARGPVSNVQIERVVSRIVENLQEVVR